MGKKNIRKRRATGLSSYSEDYPLIDFSEALNLVVRGKKTEGLRERSIIDYEKAWRYFTNWLSIDDNYLYINELTPTDFRNYINYMRYDKRKYSGHKYIDSNQQKVGLSDTTVNIQLRILKAFFNYLRRARLIEVNPLDQINLLRQDKSDYTKGLSEKEVKKIFAQPNQRDYVGFRDYVIMTLLLDTGLRVGSLLSLRVGNIDLTTRLITVDPKDVKTRAGLYVPFSSHTGKLLLQLIQENKANFRTDRLFLSSYGEPLGQNQLSKRLKYYAEQAGFDVKSKRFTAHAYRHTWATNMLRNGCDIHTLQRIGGWQDIRTLQKYLNLNIDDLKNSHESYSPISMITNKK